MELHFLAFNDTAVRVITVAWWALGILVLALLAAAVNRALVAVSRADDIVFEATVGLDAERARRFYALYQQRGPKNVALAWILSVVLGPIGAYAYLQQWRWFTIALLTLNGFGGWWVESWFSIPQLVLIENRRIARFTLEQLPYVTQLEAKAHG